MATGVPSSTAQVPGVRTFGELKRFVADYFQVANYDEELGIAGRGINSAIDLLNTRPWHWNLKSDTITFVASTSEYTVSANVKKPRKFQLLNSSSKANGYLRYLDPKTFWDANGNQVQDGTPSNYTLISLPANLKLTLSLGPDAGFVANHPTGLFHYHARIPYMTQDGEQLATPPEVWSFCGWYARHDLAGIQGAPVTQTDRAHQMWNTFWQQLVIDDNNVEQDF